MKKTFVDVTWQDLGFQPIQLALVGSLLIALSSLVRIPLYPVPFTLQTFAIFLIGLTQSPKQAFGTAACYLFLASMGLPVLGGKINPLWMTGKCGGYLLAFPIAALSIAWIRQKQSNVVALLFGIGVIFLLGWIFLLPFLGAKVAFIKGVWIFLPSEGAKMILALVVGRWRVR